MEDEKKTADGWVLIDGYSRRQAMDDGLLVDVSGMAKDAGIRHPVALTRTVYDSYVAIDERVAGDVDGRLWDVVWMLSCAIRREPDGREVRFALFVNNGSRQVRRVELKAVCGPDDDASPCITVMQLWED